jgi:hypothetical protein
MHVSGGVGGQDPRERWLSMIGAELALAAESVFPETAGYFARRANDRRAKLLKALAPTLARMLEPGERIRYAARAVQYFLWEFAFGGHLTAHYTNQTALVLTDRRLLLIQVGGSGKPRDIKNHIRLDRVTSRRARGWLGGHWTLQLDDGSKHAFMNLQKRDRKALEAGMPETASAAKAARRALEHLCPSCFSVIPGRVGEQESCSNGACRIPFRDPRRAAWLSLLMPGVGDLYLRHYFFGAAEFLGSLAMLVAAIFVGVGAVGAEATEDLAIAAVAGALLIVVPRLIDYPLTLHMGRKGLVPLALRPAPLRPEEGGVISPGGPERLPAFPLGVKALFLAGGIAAAGASVLTVPLGRAAAELRHARRAAEAGRFDEAWAKWEAAAANADDEDRARLALAFYKGGDLESGDRLVEMVAGRSIDVKLANEINAFLDRARSASSDMDAGWQALYARTEDEAWPAFERAFAFYANVKRPALPRSRDEVRLEAAGELLGPPLSPADAAYAQTLLSALPPATQGARLDIARARLLLHVGDAARARALLDGVRLAGLPPAWALLALEARAAHETPQAIASAASSIAATDDRTVARRAALLALGGELPELSAPVAAAAGDLADSQGWPDAARRLRAKR